MVLENEVSLIVTKHSTHNPLLPSLLRGLYARVARQLGVDPSYVSRVARGERRSEEISRALEQEMERILSRSAEALEEDRNRRSGNKTGR